MEGKALHQNCNASWRRSGVGASGLCHYLRAGGAAPLAGQSAPPLDVVESVLDAYAPLSEALRRDQCFGLQAAPSSDAGLHGSDRRQLHVCEHERSRGGRDLQRRPTHHDHDGAAAANGALNDLSITAANDINVSLFRPSRIEFSRLTPGPMRRAVTGQPMSRRRIVEAMR